MQIDFSVDQHTTLSGLPACSGLHSLVTGTAARTAQRAAAAGSAALSFAHQVLVGFIQCRVHLVHQEERGGGAGHGHLQPPEMIKHSAAL